MYLATLIAADGLNAGQISEARDRLRDDDDRRRTCGRGRCFSIAAPSRADVTADEEGGDQP